MKPLFQFLPILAVPLVVSCDRKMVSVVDEEQGRSYEVTSTTWHEFDFTAWMSRAELRILQEKTEEYQYFARVEGRNNRGRLEYRAALRPFPVEQYEQWAVFWGIGEEELFDLELRFLRSGFIRREMQLLTGPDGRTLHQLVWLKPVSRPRLIGYTPASADAAADMPSASVMAEADRDGGERLDPVVDAAGEPVGEMETDRVEPAGDPRPPRVHVIQPGDTLGGIARRYNASVRSLRAENRLQSDLLRVGRKLVIPVDDDGQSVAR